MKNPSIILPPSNEVEIYYGRLQPILELDRDYSIKEIINYLIEHPIV
jgi:hypothetical protein